MMRSRHHDNDHDHLTQHKSAQDDYDGNFF